MRNFVRSRNVILLVTFVLLGIGAFAFLNRETIIAVDEQVVTIDNTYIAEVDLARFSPIVTVLGVTEDAENYYVEYEFSTIAQEDAVWQDVTTTETLTVLKQQLNQHRDLGLCVTPLLNEKITVEEKRLLEAQILEQSQKTTKQTLTKYRGMIGGFFSEQVTDFERYRPVVRPPKPKQEVLAFTQATAQAASTSTSTEEAESSPESEEPVEPANGVVAGEATTTEPVVTDLDSASTDGSSIPTNAYNEAPTLMILGKNPARVVVGGAYVDLGAVVIDDNDTALAVDVYVGGRLVGSVALETATATTFSIVYVATDRDGVSSQVERVVEVYEPLVQPATSEAKSEAEGDDSSTSTAEIEVDTAVPENENDSSATGESTDEISSPPADEVPQNPPSLDLPSEEQGDTNTGNPGGT